MDHSLEGSFSIARSSPADWTYVGYSCSMPVLEDPGDCLNK